MTWFGWIESGQGLQLVSLCYHYCYPIPLLPLRLLPFIISSLASPTDATLHIRPPLLPTILPPPFSVLHTVRFPQVAQGVTGYLWCRKIGCMNVHMCTGTHVQLLDLQHGCAWTYNGLCFLVSFFVQLSLVSKASPDLYCPSKFVPGPFFLSKPTNLFLVKKHMKSKKYYLESVI